MRGGESEGEGECAGGPERERERWGGAGRARRHGASVAKRAGAERGKRGRIQAGESGRERPRAERGGRETEQSVPVTERVGRKCGVSTTEGCAECERQKGESRGGAEAPRTPKWSGRDAQGADRGAERSKSEQARGTKQPQHGATLV